MKNWFDQGGKAYAAFRPQYPPELAQFLKSCVPSGEIAFDVGCGTGQLTYLLADHFKTVIGTDPSADQISNAAKKANITYKAAPAEKLGGEDGSVDLITAAQAAHWFDRPQFYKEVRRLAKPEATLALISYGVLSFEDAALDRLFSTFYHDEISPYWPPERTLVDSGYQTIDFPFDEMTPPPFNITLEWDRDQFLGYLSTWSATRKAREAGQEKVLHRFADQLNEAWEKPPSKQIIHWPIHMRLGMV